MTLNEVEKTLQHLKDLTEERDKLQYWLRRVLEISYTGHPDGRETRLEMITRYCEAALKGQTNA